MFFAKLLGAGKGETFTPRDADIHRWGFLVVIDENQLSALDQSSMVKQWRKISTNEYRILLDPISSHGKWSRQEPFKVKENVYPRDAYIEEFDKIMNVQKTKHTFLTDEAINKLKNTQPLL